MGNIFKSNSEDEDNYFEVPRNRTPKFEVITDFFLQNMPKVELHAHLNGSLNYSSMRELGKYVYSEGSEKFAELMNCNTDDCFKKSKILHELTSTKQGLTRATLLVIRDFALENVIHLELYTTPTATANMSKREYLNCVLDAIKEAAIIYDTISVKLLPSIDRSQTVQDAKETLNDVLYLRKNYSDIIAGIAFSGNPNCGEFKHFIPMLKYARYHELKLAINCAETDNREEIDEILDFGMERCGHGTFLSAEQMELLSRRRVAIECCLTSNVKSGTVRSYDDHHFRRIFADELAPVVLCTENCDTTLTKEFIWAVDTFRLNRLELLRLSLNAARYAFVEDWKKSELENIITKSFIYERYV